LSIPHIISITSFGSRLLDLFCVRLAALRFQPNFRRPQQTTQKPKAKAGLRPPQAQENSQTQEASSQPRPSSNVPPARNNLSQWTSIGDDDDVNGFYAGEKRQRGGRKKRKKNKEESAIPQNWDDIYDPSRPNNYEEYKHSDEKIREIRDWKDRLYAHRIARRGQSGVADSDSDESISTARNSKLTLA
jgi:splicing factor 45